MKHPTSREMAAFLFSLIVTVIFFPVQRSFAITQLPATDGALVSFPMGEESRYLLNGYPVSVRKGWSYADVPELATHWRTRMACPNCGLELSTPSTTILAWWSANRGLSALDLFSIVGASKPADGLGLHLTSISRGKVKSRISEWSTLPGFSPESVFASTPPARTFPQVVAPEGQLMWTLVPEAGGPEGVTVEVWLLAHPNAITLPAVLEENPEFGAHHLSDVAPSRPIQVLVGKGGKQAVAVLIQQP